MLFNSLEFLFFFPVVVTLYFATPHRHRWALLLVASYYFYASWKLEYLVLIVGSTGVDYWTGLQMGKRRSRRARRPFLAVSLLANLGILFAFKYWNFFNESTQALFSGFGMTYDPIFFDVLLPVGISFYTFQTLAYSIDVYRDQQRPERHLGYFALYVSFFPQLVAGPIERSQRLLPQFKKQHAFDYENVVLGLNKIAYGFFKKLVVADRLALYVNSVFANIEQASSLTMALAVFFFAIQIYCDFSGYSDIAIGAARIMGYDLMENFRRPYLSRSIQEFWRRWHISLSTWFRDYLYIPLGGNRVTRWRWYCNLFIVFFISGLWHGAAWTFAIWGALHGLYLVAGQVTTHWRERFWARMEDAWAPVSAAQQRAGWVPPLTVVRRIAATGTTFVLVLFAWIFFRAQSLGEATRVIAKIAEMEASLNPMQLTAGLGPDNFVLSFVAIGLLGLSYRLPFDLRLRHNTAFLIVTTLVIILLGVNASNEFIYFQF